ncbi:MAG: AraC family transcriptional regulator [Paracoccaceae bacterium]
MKLFSGPPLSQFSDSPARKEDTDAGHVPQAKARAANKTASKPEQKVRGEVIMPEVPQQRLRITPIPRLASGGRWRVEAMRSLSEPLLLWFTRGQGRITVGGVTRGYGAHNAVFIPAGVMHGFDVGNQTFGSAVFFGKCAHVLPAEAHHLRIRDVAPQGELSVLIDNIQRELTGARPGHERAADNYVGLLSVWLERQIELMANDARKPGAALRLARRYTALIEDDFRSGKTVAHFARDLGVTTTHLTRVCNQTCGRSASDLLHDRVIFEARKMLSESTLPIGQVAQQLGFASAAYFTRAFQHRTGKTPSAFRRHG